MQIGGEFEAFIVDCTFLNNHAGWGGAVDVIGFLPHSNPQFINCRFIGNTATGSPALGPGLGGAILQFAIGPLGMSTELVNCVFSGNSASGDGGAICMLSESQETSINTLDLRGCTFSGNTAGGDGGGLNWAGLGVGWPMNEFIARSCVFWENEDGGGTDESAQIFPLFEPNGPLVAYSCIQDLTFWSPLTNIGDDPLFCDADGADDLVGTLDDNLRLDDGSPCIDAGSDADVPPDVADIDEDPATTILPWDLDKRTRMFDAVAMGTDDVDMGAYENQHDAACIWDVSGDGQVSTVDLLALLADWGDDCPGCAADFTCDATVSTADLLQLVANWGLCPQQTGQEPPTLEEELAAACLTMDDWDDFVDSQTDPTLSAQQKANWRCWMNHYLENCSKCACSHNVCPGTDPF